MDQFGLVPRIPEREQPMISYSVHTVNPNDYTHHTKIQSRPNQPNLISHPVRHKGSLGVVQHDALFPIQPARLRLDLGDNGSNADD